MLVPYNLMLQAAQFMLILCKVYGAKVYSIGLYQAEIKQETFSLTVLKIQPKHISQYTV